MGSLPRDEEGKIIFDFLSDGDCRDTEMSFMPEKRDGELSFADSGINTDVSRIVPPETKRVGNQSREYKHQEMQTSEYGEDSASSPFSVAGAASLS